MSPRTAATRRHLATASLVAATVSALTLTSMPAGAAPAPAPPAAGQAQHASLGRAFADAAARHDVPRDLLVALGWSETHLDGHDGAPSQANGFGVMHLVDNPEHRTLREAAGLTGRPLARLRTDSAANIDGAAAVLRSYADDLRLTTAERRDPGAWYRAVARYSGAGKHAAALYADTVYDFLAKGLLARPGGGEEIVVVGRPVSPDKGGYAGLRASGTTFGAQSPDYGPARWVPASSSNYTTGRSAAVDKVVVHVTQGSYAGAISWFQNPSSDVSAHYVIRSSDGEVTQMVRNHDTAWHARSANSSSLGIEHEGWVDEPSWFTDTMYRSSAALTRHLCDTYGIPKDRTHVRGHNELPDNDHTDPGQHWNWTYYMELVRGGSDSGDGISFTSYPTVKRGASGAHVKAVQTLLKAQSFDPGAVDGQFGPATEAAVTAFQTSRKLAADGVVGPRTWTALLSAGEVVTVRRGSTGEAVKRLQRALTAALGRTVDVDGQFGPATESAVVSYQSSRDLAADGIAGPATWGALQAGR
ncbi:peptidoglycan-binding protein [Streptomyces sp. MAR4 CNX-425]|uniref:peptidoglycan recognition protein family protein n=1 Tax=Streptomyces sp. MAR4 CNX-425 TaxID=3406343 RepID=UPI003B50E63A